jgi:hypothetical protein
MEPIRDHSEPRNISSDFFARVPLRSYYFLAGTITMGIDVAVVGFLLVRFWNQMPTIAIVEIGFGVSAMLVLWDRAYVSCRRLHEVYSQAKSSPSFARSPLDTALRNAAAITGASLSFSFFIAAWLLLALVSILRGR